MKKIILLLSLFMFMAGSVCATTFYYEATNVVGYGSIVYGLNTSGVTDAPAEFSFVGSEGTVETNLESFVAGEYTMDFYLNGLWADINEDHQVDFGPTSVFTLNDIGPIDLPVLSLNGSYGPLTWNFDPYSSFFLALDFGDNTSMLNGLLASLDPNTDGIMDAYIGWDKLRVELNSAAPVPEPSTFILLGAGIAGLAIYRKKKS